MDKTSELKSVLAMLPIEHGHEEIFEKFFPHLSKSQIPNLCGAGSFNFAVPYPDDPNKVYILEYYPGMSEEEAEFDIENCEDSDDESEEPACIFFAAKIDIRTQNTWSDDITGSKALFIKEAIDWQLSRQTNSCE